MRIRPGDRAKITESREEVSEAWPGKRKEGRKNELAEIEGSGGEGKRAEQEEEAKEEVVEEEKRNAVKRRKKGSEADDDVRRA